MKTKNELEKIGNILYDKHAIERMEERKIFPMLVEYAIKNGEHYKLKHIRDYEETSGATDAYIVQNCADVLPGGKIGERIIPIEPARRRHFDNFVVLVGKNNVVKTAYTADNKRLNDFLNKYAKKEK